MAHIHEKIDFTVAIFVVQEAKVLLIHHRKLNRWLPLGGHIELDEDPEFAALREAREESGLEVELIGERPPTTEPKFCGRCGASLGGAAIAWTTPRPVEVLCPGCNSTYPSGTKFCGRCGRTL
jgi:8-oxo-dGTP pyrophosphatase MutT (NUDIX family)